MGAGCGANRNLRTKSLSGKGDSAVIEDSDITLDYEFNIIISQSNWCFCFTILGYNALIRLAFHKVLGINRIIKIYQKKFNIMSFDDQIVLNKKFRSDLAELLEIVKNEFC